MNIAINWKYRDKISKKNMYDFNGSFSNEDLPIGDFVNAVHNGHAYTSWHGPYRKKENWICAQHAALDFDTEDENSSFASLIEDDFIRDNATFLHTTQSHTEEKPRSRVVFILDEVVEDPERYKLLLKALLYRFPLADESCKDIARFFYGSTNCEILKVGNTLGPEAIEELIDSYLEGIKFFKTTQDYRESHTNKVIWANEVPDSFLASVAKKMISHILEAPDGQKHDTLNVISYAFGGFVANGYYKEEDVRRWLREAITSRNIKSRRGAFNTIEDGLRDGKRSPSFFYKDGNDYVYDEPPRPVHRGEGKPEKDVERGYGFFLI